MQFTIGGKSYQIPDTTPALGRLFIHLHAAYLSNGAFNWDEFNKEVSIFFDAAYNNLDSQEAFFNSFTILWREFLADGRFERAEGIWELALRPAIAWDAANAPRRIHKGSPFYYWGIAAILRGDLDKGYALMHTALLEDVKTTGDSFPNTAAFALATLDYTKVDQAFRQWVLDQARYIQDRTDSYRVGNGKALALGQFQAKFLASPPSTETLYLLAYTIARLMRIHSHPSYMLQTGFASQLLLNIFFDLTLVIDATIRCVNPSQWRFIDNAAFIASSTAMSVTRQDLEDLNACFIRDFGGTIQSLIDGTYSRRGGSKLSGLEVDLAVAYGVRNRGAHSLEAVPVVWQSSEVIERMLFNVLFTIVEHLY